MGSSYVSSCSEDLREDHSGQTVSAVVQCGYGEFQHSVLVLYGAQIQQAANTKMQANYIYCQHASHT